MHAVLNTRIDKLEHVHACTICLAHSHFGQKNDKKNFLSFSNMILIYSYIYIYIYDAFLCRRFIKKDSFVRPTLRANCAPAYGPPRV